MPDAFDKETRSWIMSRIRKTDTQPELMVRKFLFHSGLRYRLYRRDLPGNPDIVLGRQKVAIYVNGCFWHAHEGCKLNRPPKSRPEYWIPKIRRNVDRDVHNHLEIAQLGWIVIVVWECELKKNSFVPTMEKLIQTIINHSTRK
jgi:DNA mismatch endonuclease, patch repair protein